MLLTGYNNVQLILFVSPTGGCLLIPRLLAIIQTNALVRAPIIGLALTTAVARRVTLARTQTRPFVHRFARRLTTPHAISSNHG